MLTESLRYVLNAHKTYVHFMTITGAFTAEKDTIN